MARHAMPASPAESGAGSLPAMGMTLDAAQNTLSAAAAWLEWLGRWQAASTQALLNWHIAIQAARMDLARGQGTEALLAAQAQLATRQFELALEQAGSAWKLLLEDELRAGDRLRGQAVAMAGRLLPADGVADAARPDGAFGAWQHACFGLAQHWADAMNPAARH